MLGDRWGITAAEAARHYPCDDFVANPRMQAWRAVTVDAPAQSVWPWVAQIRIAPYSYDWIDNLGRTSPPQLRDLPEPVIGEPFTTAATRHFGRILSVDTNKQLTARIAGVVISYVLEPDSNTTRLLMKLTAATGGPLAWALCIGDLVMARRQLLNLKRLAEQGAAAPAG